MSAPIMVACSVAALALALPVIASASALEAHTRNAAAADAAALAAADALNGWIDEAPCDVAEHIAVEFQVVIVECALDPDTGEARILTQSETIFGGVQSRARAGPPVG